MTITDAAVPSSARPAAKPSHKLWGGRFGGGPTPEFDALNNSIGIDFRLWPYDIRLSKAWAVALWGAGVLTLEESRAIERGLDAVGARLAAGEQPQPSDEDVHTLIDRLLHEEIGDVASRLHTGRSRNDQVATATRLWTMDVCQRLDYALRALQGVMLEQAESLESALMPSYTHLQRAIPVSGAHWLLSHFWPLERDRARLRAAQRSTAVLPLGSGAVAGSAYPISRVLLQGTLGFDAVSPNSIDAVSDRDFIAEVLFAATLIGTHLSRFAEDLIIYGSSEFGFVQFGEGYTSGSSMMPQKRNPDALELARGSAARMLGNLTTLLATLKGLPTSYNKDLQDDKRVLFDATDTLLLVLPATAGALAECTFRRERMATALSSTMMATDLADYLVRRGATFREAHGAVGSLVREGEERGVELTALPFSSFSRAHPRFGEDVYDALSAANSVTHREVEGGTGPAAVRTQLEAARTALLPPPTPRSTNAAL
ncbi:MAG TPA: argininosuccinate lyase [Gemmatimonadaceae bacterium]|nr:argininosuccinate lyase [Gemmatimonadaceae bacterium]